MITYSALLWYIDETGKAKYRRFEQIDTDNTRVSNDVMLIAKKDNMGVFTVPIARVISFETMKD